MKQLLTAGFGVALAFASASAGAGTLEACSPYKGTFLCGAERFQPSGNDFCVSSKGTRYCERAETAFLGSSSKCYDLESPVADQADVVCVTPLTAAISRIDTFASGQGGLALNGSVNGEHVYGISGKAPGHFDDEYVLQPSVQAYKGAAAVRTLRIQGRVEPGQGSGVESGTLRLDGQSVSYTVGH
jgi:hypothetical protein